MDKLLYLQQYHKDIKLIHDPVKAIDNIPSSWVDILGENDKKKKISILLDSWSKNIFPCLQNTIMYLREYLDDVELIFYNENYSLLYTILNSNGEALYYEGRVPGKSGITDKLLLSWPVLPSSIRTFYEHLHNGFYYYASESMGLLPLEDVVVFEDEDWGILDDLTDPLQIHLPTTFGFFASGMGGYVALDSADCDEGKSTLWFTNRQPKYNVNFWDVVDEWIVIGMQN